MAGWIKMPLGMQVGLGPSDIVLDPAPLPKKAQSPQFSAHVYCRQTAGWTSSLERERAYSGFSAS